MKMNLHLEITDELRNRLANIDRSKPTKRLATRQEIYEYVTGALHALENKPNGKEKLTAAIARNMTPDGFYMGIELTPDEQRERARLTDEGRSDSYIRGWILAGRRIHA